MLFVVVIIVSIFAPNWVGNVNQPYHAGDTDISDDWNRDVKNLLREYSFDVADIDIEERLYDDLDNGRRVPGHVPEELEDGNLLIVVR